MRVTIDMRNFYKEDRIKRYAPKRTPKLPDQELGRKREEGTAPVLRSLRLKYKRSSFGEDGKPTAPKKRLKLHNKELGRKLEEGAASSVKSLRLKNKGASRGEYCKPTARKKESGRRPALISTILTTRQIAEYALRNYNEKHGTDLELVRLLDDKERDMLGPGYTIDFTERTTFWKHFNFEARSRSADPSDKPFLLFAEVYRKGGKYFLTTLSLVNLTDKSYGCQRCWSYINHPRHGFRAGFDTSMAGQPKVLSEQAASGLLECALQDYNEKYGTNVKFEGALKYNSFTCEGLLMDLSKKNTSWVHMSFEATVGPKEEVLRLFGELYLGDDGKYVLATLSVAEPSDTCGGGRWKKDFLDHGCRFCPDVICHPWRGYGFGFNYRPINIPPDIYAKTHGLEIRNIIQN